MGRPAKLADSTDLTVADDSINSLTAYLSRDDLITYLYIFKGITQTQIADILGLSQALISGICKRTTNDEDTISRIIGTVKKDTAYVCYTKANEAVKAIDINGLTPKDATFLHNLGDTALGISNTQSPTAIQINVVQYGKDTEVERVKVAPI